MDAVTLGIAKAEARKNHSPLDRSSVVLVGDSRIGNEIDNRADPRTTRMTGAFNWANITLRQRFTVRNYAGVSSNTTAQVLARYADDVLAFKPGIVIIGDCINDISTSVPIATIKANTLAMITANRSIGAKTVLLTVAPDNAHNTAQRTVLSELNRWILTLGGYGDVHIVDVCGPVVSLDAMTWRSDLSVDGLHQNKIAAARQGKALAAVLEKLAPPIDPLPLYAGDPLNPVANSLMAGTLGATYPAGFQILGPSGTTCKLVARTDGRPGQWAEIENVVAGSSTIANTSGPQAIPASWIPGTTRVFAVAEFESDPWAVGGTSGPQLSLMFDAGGAATHTLISNAASDSATYPLDLQQGVGGPVVLRTPSYTVPVGTTRFRQIGQCYYQGKLRWTRLAVYPEL